MLSFQSHDGFVSCSNNNNNNNNNNNGFVIQEPSLVNVMDDGESILSSALKAEIKKSTESCKSHKEAERRRRQRINAHLSTLRTLLPNTTKADKASLLAEVVHRVKELKRQAADLASQNQGGFCSTGSSGPEPEQYWPFPGESDEATLSYFDGEARTVKVSVCCEDRPGLNQDLTQAIRSVRAKVVRAEMMTVGGRNKSMVVMQWGSGGGGEEVVGVLQRALKAVVENRASGSGLGPMVHGNKRSRIVGLGSTDVGDDFLNGKTTINLLEKGK